MILYVLLDTSGSMQGSKIGALNDCMSNIIIDLQEKAYNGKDITLSVLSFSRKVSWMYDFPRSVLDFDWKPLEANGMTSLGEACVSLSNHMDTYVHNEETTIVLVSDGCPTDDFDEGLLTLTTNKSFLCARKYAIAVGEDADLKSLMQFTQDAHTVYGIENVSNLFDLLLSLLDGEHDSVQTAQTSDHVIQLDDSDDWS